MTPETGPQPPPLPKGADEAFCSSCGNPIKLQAEICPNCGFRQRKGADKTALALLAFFLGGFGAHKFYLGKYGQGFFYILFFWTGIPGLIAFVEFIIYLCTPREKIAQKYTSKGPGVVVAVVACFFGFIFVIGILAAIAIPNFIAFRQKATCVQVEMEANNALAAMEEFFADPNNTHVPSLEELVSATGLEIDNRISLYIDGNRDGIQIQAAHKTARCPNGESYVVSIADEVVAQWQ
ncbi:MAG: TM2 domain-containing protein [Desulfobacterales bacterium]|jgi:TM2 domain-containing membrane protein YozV/Tfp pilus assembly major pilin PilA